MRTTFMKKNLDKQIDNNMLIYDRMMHEKQEQGEGKRYLESRKKRTEMETMELGNRR